MKTIDSEVLAGYNSGREKGRLHRGLGLIEFERTKEILLEELPGPELGITRRMAVYNLLCDSITASCLNLQCAIL